MNDRFKLEEKDRDNTTKQRKNIAFSFGSLQLSNSCSFLSWSLDKVVAMNKFGKDKKLDTNWTEHFKFTNSNPCDKDVYGLDLLTDKGVDPFDYMTDFSKIDETELQSKQASYSYLHA